MLVIDVELLHGTIRAGSPDDLALTGQDDPGEWPPSPARLFAALVAAGTRDRWTFSDGSELDALERAGHPRIHCDGSRDVLSSSVQARFVVRNTAATNSVQEYAARKAEPARPGTRKSPTHPRVTYVWQDLKLDDGALAATRRRAAMVGYLGCADSPVRVRVGETLPPDVNSATWEPTDDGRTAVPVPFAGLTEVLDTIYQDFKKRDDKLPTGVRRSAYRTRRAWYRDPSSPPMPTGEGQPEIIWLRFDRAVSGRRVLAVTTALKDAVLDLFPAAREDVPELLHGHIQSPDPGGHEQARYLALPRADDDHADGRIHGGAVWLPPATSTATIEGVRAAVFTLTRNGLVRRGVFSTGVAIHGGESRPWSANPDRWTRPARHWSSVFPVVHERWSRHGPTLEDATEWCKHAGLPAPIAMRSGRTPYLRGAVDLHPTEANRPGRERRPYSHVTLRFEEPVHGPVVIGRSRSFGLGLMAPIDAGGRNPGASDG